jgi:hypothetical protein
MKRALLSIACLCILSLYGHAQSSKKSFFGIGTGLDYGGIGMRVEFQPVNAIGIFAGFGYNLATPAYNFGINIIPAPKKRFSPVFVGMYGYNAAIKIKRYGGDVAKTYYGVTGGIGFQLYNKAMRNKLLVEVLIPSRNSSFKKDYADYNRSGVQFNPKPRDVYFSIGYNFGINPKAKK